MNVVSSFFAKLSHMTHIFPQVQILPDLFAAFTKESRMDASTAKRLIIKLKKLSVSVDLNDMAEQFHIICALSRTTTPKGGSPVCWGDKIEPEFFKQTLHGLEFFLPAIGEEFTFYHHHAFTALMLVCGHIATLKLPIDNCAYSHPHIFKDAFYNEKYTVEHKVNPDALQQLYGFAKDLNFYKTFNIVKLFCAAIIEYAQRIEFESYFRTFQRQTVEATITRVLSKQIKELTNIPMAGSAAYRVLAFEHIIVFNKKQEENFPQTPSSQFSQPISVHDILSVEVDNKTPAAYNLVRHVSEEEKKEEPLPRMEVDEMLRNDGVKNNYPKFCGKIFRKDDPSSVITIDVIKADYDAIEQISCGIVMETNEFCLDLSVKSRECHLSREARGKKSLYTGTINVLNQSKQAGLWKISLCSIASINNHFGTKFDLTGTSQVGKMNSRQFGHLLEKKVVDKVNKHADANMAKVIEAVQQVSNSFSEKIDMSMAASSQNNNNNIAEMSVDQLELSIQHQIDMLNKKKRQAAEEQEAVRQAELEAAQKLKKREEKAQAKKAEKQQKFELLQADILKSQQEQMAQFAAMVQQQMANQLAAAQKGLESSSDSEEEGEH